MTDSYKFKVGDLVARRYHGLPKAYHRGIVLKKEAAYPGNPQDRCLVFFSDHPAGSSQRTFWQREEDLVLISSR
jgi:hypothetical protein